MSSPARLTETWDTSHLPEASDSLSSSSEKFTNKHVLLVPGLPSVLSLPLLPLPTLNIPISMPFPSGPLTPSFHFSLPSTLLRRSRATSIWPRSIRLTHVSPYVRGQCKMYHTPSSLHIYSDGSHRGGENKRIPERTSGSYT